jgi:hypothetical protein
MKVILVDSLALFSKVCELQRLYLIEAFLRALQKEHTASIMAKSKRRTFGATPTRQR